MSSKVMGILMVAALLVGSFLLGDAYRDNAWHAKQAATERAAAEQYKAEVQRGDAATARLAAAQRQHTAVYKGFERQFNDLRKRVPLVVAASRSGGCAGGPALPQAPGLADADGVPDVAVLGLTTGAVWMWNTALAGTDQPSGACGAASTTTAACAVATEVTLDDAWASHTANAEVCNANRLAHQQLIDFLNSRPQQKQGDKP